MYKVTLVQAGTVLTSPAKSLDDALQMARGTYSLEELQRFVFVHCDGDLRVAVAEPFKGDTVTTTIRRQA